MLHALREAALSALVWIEAKFDACFGPRANPWRHLGALGFLLFWIIVVSGTYLYAVLDTSVEGTYRSIDHLSRAQWYFGGIVRSLHRYASDAFVLVTLLHLLRELVNGRFHGFRWFSWISGVPLLWLTFAAGVGGFWLVWDGMAQFSAIATMEWLDWLNIFAQPLTRNFLSAGSVSDRLFSLFVFLHIGIPLLLLLGLWIHVQRITRPQVSPAFALTCGTLVSLLALSLAVPVQSAAPANLGVVEAQLALDWFYLAPHAVMYATTPAMLWALASAATIALITLPWWRRRARQPVARVDPQNCNGCRRCVADCPYAAIIMQPQNPVHPRVAVAVVDPDLCASCGICAGACPSATPFRSVDVLRNGIDMPQMPMHELREELKLQLAGLRGAANVVLIGCDRAVDVRARQSTDTATLSLICSGQLPPSFVEYALRNGADGVLVTGCGECDCSFRLGNEWTEQRMRGVREPHLRAKVRDERVHVVWASASQRARLERELVRFRETLTRLADRKRREPRYV